MNNLFTRILIWFHAGVLILLFLWVSVGNWVAEEQWKAAVPPIEQQLLQSFPSRSADTNALAIQNLSRALGLELTFDDSSNSNSLESVHSEIDEFLNSLTISPPNVGTFPQPLQNYLTKYRSDITKIVQYLINNNLPRWKRSVINLVYVPEEFIKNSSLNYKNLHKLHRLLLANSLDYQYHNQSELAHKSLLAAWNLRQSLNDQPLGISLTMVREEADVLRQINYHYDDWQQRLASLDMMKLKHKLTAWSLIHAKFIKMTINNSNYFHGLNNIFRPLIQPYLTFAAIDFLRKDKPLISQNTCLLKSRIPKDFSWNLPYSMYTFRKSSWVERAALNLELTNKVFQFKNSVIRSQKIPKFIPDFESSKICQNIRWNYEAKKYGSVKIASQDNKFNYTFNIDNLLSH